MDKKFFNTVAAVVLGVIVADIIKPRLFARGS